MWTVLCVCVQCIYVCVGGVCVCGGGARICAELVVSLGQAAKALHDHIDLSPPSLYYSVQMRNGV